MFKASHKALVLLEIADTDWKLAYKSVLNLQLMSSARNPDCLTRPSHTITVPYSDKVLSDRQQARHPQYLRVLNSLYRDKMSDNRVEFNCELYGLHEDCDFLHEIHELRELDQLDLELQEDELPGLSAIEVSELQELIDILNRKIQDGLNLLALVESQETDSLSIETKTSSQSSSIDSSCFESHWNTPIPTPLLEARGVIPKQPVEALPGAISCQNKCTLSRGDPFFRHFQELAARQGPLVPAKSRFFPMQVVSAS